MKLTDFGLARPDPGVDDRTSTLPRMVLGTPGYLAPAQLAGGEIDQRADVAALLEGRFW